MKKLNSNLEALIVNIGHLHEDDDKLAWREIQVFSGCCENVLNLPPKVKIEDSRESESRTKALVSFRKSRSRYLTSRDNLVAVFDLYIETGDVNVVERSSMPMKTRVRSGEINLYTPARKHDPEVQRRVVNRYLFGDTSHNLGMEIDTLTVYDIVFIECSDEIEQELSRRADL